MPRFFYDCPEHGNEIWLDGFFADPPEEIDCRWCDRKARRVRLSVGLLVVPDVIPHWNPTIDRYVKSRRHLTDLQRRSQDTENPFGDHEAITTRSSDWTEKPNRPAKKDVWVESFRSGGD